MITISPMLPGKNPQTRKIPNNLTAPLRAIAACAWICAAVSISGLVFGIATAIQDGARAEIVTVRP